MLSQEPAISNCPHKSDTFVTTHEAALMFEYHPKSRAHLCFYFDIVIIDCSILFPFCFFHLTFQLKKMFKALKFNLENEIFPL